MVDQLARSGGSVREIARERIEILLGLARQAFPRDRSLSKRYIELARQIGMKAGVRLPREQKMFICRNCGALLVPGENCHSQNSVGRWDNGVNYMLGVWSKEAISNREGTAFDKKRLRRLQSKSRETDATIWIGKEGASDELLKQVSNQLRARELVKLKVHKSALANMETEQLAAKVASSTSSTLVEVMGHTFTVFKRRQIAQQRKTH